MHRHFANLPSQFAWLLLAMMLPAATIQAQDIWEFSPYDVRIWIATGGSSLLGPNATAQLREAVHDRCETVIRSPWDTKVEAAPEEFAAEMLTRLDAIPAADVVASSREVALADKLFLVGVYATPDNTRIQVRELDCRSREFGNVVERTMTDPTQVAQQTFATIVAAFRPIAKVESTKDRDRQATMRIRAGGLVTTPTSPILIEPGAILQPYVRNNDRNGEPSAKLGIQKLPWTYCTVAQREETLITCQIQSGTRVPVSGRPNQRIQRFAVLAPINPGKTTLTLQSTAKRAEPLSGYDVYAKDPITDKQELLGRTDWRGTMEIPMSENPLRLIYVRNGSQLLARLPVIPGLEKTRTVQITSDDQRLQVEGMLSGVQSWIMDVVANRELVKARFHKRLDETKIPDAKKLLDEYLAIDSRDDIERVLNLEQARQKSEYPTVQKKIDKLFDTTRSLLTKHVPADEGNQLINEYNERRGDAPDATSTEAAKPSAPARQAGGATP